MLREALRQNKNRQQTAISARCPAPTAGWDAISPLASMKPDSAVILDNWVPRPGYVEIRKGSRGWQIGSASPVESLIPWKGNPSGVDQLFAAAGTGIFPISTMGGAWPASSYTITNPRVESTQFTNSGGSFVICANGSDVPFRYDGSTWAALSIAGSSGPIVLDQTKLDQPCNHSERLHFIEKGTLRTWFLATNAIQGPAQLLDLGTLFQFGGTIVAHGTWPKGSIYALSQSDLYTVITSNGEVAVYQGDDPSNVLYWSLLGIFRIGNPLGARSLIKFGADLLAITTNGAESYGQALQLDRSQQNNVALTQKIQNAFLEASMSYGSNFGWNVMIFPPESLVFINVPTAELSTSVQFVQNIQTGAWCRFTGMNAFCWETVNDEMFYGGSDGVYQWGVGGTDNGNNLVADLKTAFNYFGDTSQKNFTMVRPILNVTADVLPAIEIDTDFSESTPIAVPSVILSRSPNLSIRAEWNGAQGVGFCGAVRMRVTLQTGQDLQAQIGIGNGNWLGDGNGNDIVRDSGNPIDADIQFINADVLYERGGPI